MKKKSDAMAETPVASPSETSRILIALLIPISHRKVKGIVMRGLRATN